MTSSNKAAMTSHASHYFPLDENAASTTAALNLVVSDREGTVLSLSALH
jgi:hypothetical protein